MKSKHPKNDTAKRSSRYFCGLSRRAQSPGTRSSKTPPPNAIPVATAAIQQHSENSNSALPTSKVPLSPLPSQQPVAPQSPVGGQSSRGAQSRAQPRAPQYNMFAHPLRAVPVQASTTLSAQSQGNLFQAPSVGALSVQTPAHWILPLRTPPSQASPLQTLPLQASDLSLHTPSQTEPQPLTSSSTKSHRPVTPVLSPLSFQKFISLPREIRDLIWLQMLRDLSLPVPLPIKQIRKALPAFCQINRQAFCEAVPLFLQFRSIELSSKEDIKKLFQFLNQVPSGQAYRGVRSLKFENCWGWTGESAIPFLKELLAKCNCVQHITLEVTQKFIYEPMYFKTLSPTQSRADYRKQYIKMHLLPDLNRLFLHDATSLRTVRLRGSGKHDALQLSTLPRQLQSEEWLEYLEWSGRVDDPKPPDALLDMNFAEWKEFVESKEDGCSPWMENLIFRVPEMKCDASYFTGVSNYSSTFPSSEPKTHKSSTSDPIFGFASGSYKGSGRTIYESSDYYAPSGFESDSYEGSGYELPRSHNRPSGFWSSGPLSPGYQHPKPDYSEYYLRPGL